MTYQQSGGWMVGVDGRPVHHRPVSTWGGSFAPIGYVFHYTAGCGGDLSATFNGRNVSAHFSVDRDGTIYQYVPLNGRAWHADNANGIYWGVEHTALPGTCELTDPQLEASAALTATLVDYTRISRGFDIPLRKIDGPALVAGFHDHRDGVAPAWNLNGHTDHLYRWTWDRYLAAVTGGASSDEMSDYEKGMAAFADAARNGNPERIPDPSWTTEKTQGFRDARLLYNNPQPVPGPEGPQGPPGPSAAVVHTHNYANTISGTTDSGS